jgi:hypothetical protein
MSKVHNLLAGLGGAVALNILHESLKKTDKNMPRVDLLGEEALQKALRYFGTEIKDEKLLYGATLAGDIISNGIYFGAIGAGDPRYIWQRAVTMGLSAGVGAITLPEPLGLDDEPVTKTPKVKALTVGYYVVGALVTGAILSALSRKK